MTLALPHWSSSLEVSLACLSTLLPSFFGCMGKDGRCACGSRIPRADPCPDWPFGESMHLPIFPSHPQRALVLMNRPGWLREHWKATSHKGTELVSPWSESPCLAAKHQCEPNSRYQPPHLLYRRTAYRPRLRLQPHAEKKTLMSTMCGRY